MDTPTVDDIRARSPFLSEALPDPGGDAALEGLIEDATPLVASLTCRTIGPFTNEAPVPSHLEGLATRAIAFKSEELYFATGTATARRKALTNTRLKSISAGPWSESYFGLEEAAKAHMLAPDQLAHEVLWALCTDECRAKWLALWNNTVVPAAGLQSFAWDARPGRYPGTRGRARR